MVLACTCLRSFRRFLFCGTVMNMGCGINWGGGTVSRVGINLGL